MKKLLVLAEEFEQQTQPKQDHRVMEFANILSSRLSYDQLKALVEVLKNKLVEKGLNSDRARSLLATI